MKYRNAAALANGERWTNLYFIESNRHISTIRRRTVNEYSNFDWVVRGARRKEKLNNNNFARVSRSFTNSHPISEVWSWFPIVENGSEKKCLRLNQWHFQNQFDFFRMHKRILAFDWKWSAASFGRNSSRPNRPFLYSSATFRCSSAKVNTITCYHTAQSTADALLPMNQGRLSVFINWFMTKICSCIRASNIIVITVDSRVYLIFLL